MLSPGNKIKDVCRIGTFSGLRDTERLFMSTLMRIRSCSIDNIKYEGTPPPIPLSKQSHNLAPPSEDQMSPDVKKAIIWLKKMAFTIQ